VSTASRAVTHVSVGPKRAARALAALARLIFSNRTQTSKSTDAVSGQQWSFRMKTPSANIVRLLDKLYLSASAILLMIFGWVVCEARVDSALDERRAKLKALVEIDELIAALDKSVSQSEVALSDRERRLLSVASQVTGSTSFPGNQLHHL